MADPIGFEIPRLPGHGRKNDALFVYGAARAKPFVLSYVQESIEVVHGPSCNPLQEISSGRCCGDGIPIIERRGGGGTVVLSPGMVITVVVDLRRKEDSIRDIHNRIHRCMIEILAPFVGGMIVTEGISDLAINGRKILGSSLYLAQHPFLAYYQSSLMVRSDVALIARYLGHPPKEPGYRRGRSHVDFCTTLQQQSCSLSPEEICRLINRSLPQLLDSSRRAQHNTGRR